MVVCGHVKQHVPGCAKCPSKFVNLKHLILTVDIAVRDWHTSGILRLACLLELSPVLKHLELHVVYGFNNFFVLALYYARTAMALECMVIDPEARKRYALARHAIEEDPVHQGRRMANEHLRGRGLDAILTIL
ncbi:hypothetical protein ZWY2020_012960 [Hordeum vulgare]|nr:hypothetical protein ZWY2020_012960 [Hordeum vulgare]